MVFRSVEMPKDNIVAEFPDINRQFRIQPVVDLMERDLRNAGQAAKGFLLEGG